jgi:hypothetical protein
MRSSKTRYTAVANVTGVSENQRLRERAQFFLLLLEALTHVHR